MAPLSIKFPVSTAHYGEKSAAPISLLPGEPRGERVLSGTEEAAYLKAAQAMGERILERYRVALRGIGRPSGAKSQPSPSAAFVPSMLK